MNKKIAIVVDNPRRDLIGSVILASEICKKGYKAYLVPMYQQANDFSAIKPDAIIFNYARQNNLNLIKSVSDAGVKVYILDTEGGLTAKEGPRTPEAWANFVNSSGLSKYIDGYFFWGKKLYEAFLKTSGIDRTKLFVTGHPKFDLCSPRYKSLIQQSRESKILINTNFPTCVPKFSKSRDEEINNVIKIGYSREYSEKLFAEIDMVFSKFLSTIEKLIKENPDKKFTIRTHPFEDENYYTSKFSKFKNLNFESDLDIYESLVSTKAIVHVNCSTAVDAYLMGVPAYSLSFINSPFLESYASLPTEVSYRIQSYDQLMSLVKDDFENVNIEVPDKTLTSLKESFGDRDGLASVRIANVLAENISTKDEAKGNIIKGIKSVRGLKGLVSKLMGSKVSQWIEVNFLLRSRSSKVILLDDVKSIIQRFKLSEGNNSLAAKHAKNAFASLSSIEISIKD